jgi:hypothetical protein
MATKVDIFAEDGFFRGTNYTIRFAVKDATGAPQDISGWSLSYTLRKRVKDTTALITKTVGSGVTITDALAGEGQVAFAPADTASLKAGFYTHQLDRTDAGQAGSVIPGRGQAGASVRLLDRA